MPELTKWLKDDAVYFGLLRMSFGGGRFRRTKWVYLYWSGAKVAPMARAKATGARAGIKSKLGASSVDIEATSAEDVTLDAIIEKVRRSTAVDGKDDGGEDPYSVDKFMKALEEEAAASGAFFGDKGLVVSAGGPPPEKTPEQLIAELYAKESHVNWVAFTINLG